MAVPTRRRSATGRPAEPRWLTPDQLATWQAFTRMLARLPTALEVQLQSDAQLSYVEYYVLVGLSEQPELRMWMSRLAVFANAEPSRLSHMIRRLEQRGFVRREPDPADGRYTHAILTEAGYAHLVAAAPGHVDRVRDLVIDHLDETEMRVLREVSQRVLDRIEATAQE